MAEYIEREAVHRMMVGLTRYRWTSPVSTESRVTVDADDVNFGVDKIPAADVAPKVNDAEGGKEGGLGHVVHGRWERTDDQEFFMGDFECSECEHLECDIDTTCLTPGGNCLYYCPNCGAKMDMDALRELIGDQMEE